MEICRTCLVSTPPFLSLLSETYNLPNKIKLLADIDVMENADKLSTTICTPCLKTIENFILFREQIQKIDKLLKMQLEKTTKQPKKSSKYELSIKENSVLGTKIKLTTEPLISKNKWRKPIKSERPEIITCDKIIKCEEMLTQEEMSFAKESPIDEEMLTDSETSLDDELSIGEEIPVVKEIPVDTEIPSDEETHLYEEISSHEKLSLDKEVTLLEDEATPSHELLELTKNQLKDIQIMQIENDPLNEHQQLLPITQKDRRAPQVPLSEIIKTRIPEQKVYTCDNCKTFSTISCVLFYKHTVYKSCHPGGPIKNPELLPGIYGCKRCVYLTTSKTRMNSHIEAHKLQAKRYLKCNLCNFITNESRLIKQHVNTEHKGKGKEERIPCEICGKFTVKSGMRAHQLIHSEGVKCDQCGKVFTTIYNLKTHSKFHVRRDCVCETCGKSFKYEGQYWRHVKTHKTVPKKVKCDRCGKSCHTSELKKHMRTHTGEKPYQCDICSHKFITNYNLKLHMRSHTGEKPFKCNICEKAFKQNISLKTHMSNHHNA